MLGATARAHDDELVVAHALVASADGLAPIVAPEQVPDAVSRAALSDDGSAQDEQRQRGLVVERLALDAVSQPRLHLADLAQVRLPSRNRGLCCGGHERAAVSRAN